MTEFDFNAPLPPLNIRPERFMGEPAARHYRDLTPDEKKPEPVEGGDDA